MKPPLHDALETPITLNWLVRRLVPILWDLNPAIKPICSFRKLRLPQGGLGLALGARSRHSDWVIFMNVLRSKLFSLPPKNRHSWYKIAKISRFRCDSPFPIVNPTFWYMKCSVYRPKITIFDKKKAKFSSLRHDFWTVDMEKKSGL